MTTTLESPTTSALQTTALHAWHQANGGKLVPFAGWDMPLQYGRVFDEHAAVRTAAGLFDVSHMGVLTVTGPTSEAAAQWIDSVVPNAIAPLQPGQAVYSQFLNEQGGILDDCIVYRVPQAPLSETFSPFSQYFIVCNASNTTANMAWLKQHLTPGIQLTQVSPTYGLMALQGPGFKQVLASVGVFEASIPPRFTVAEATLTLPKGKTPSVILCRTGYTGEDGVEVLAHTNDMLAIWEGLLELGKSLGLLPVGLAARDTLRTEAAYSLHGHDIDPTISPLEAGLGWSVKLGKTTPYIGQSALQQQQSQGLTRQFVCLKLDGKLIARQHDAITLADGSVIGEVTSGTQSPTLGYPIAMGFVEKANAPTLGESVCVQVRGKAITATRVKRPFYSGL
jgi:aminomethyltransferase